MYYMCVCVYTHTHNECLLCKIHFREQYALKARKDNIKALP